MSERGTAKLFMHGRSQAVRLPKAFRVTGTEVRVSRVGRGILLESTGDFTLDDVRAVSAELERLNDEPFMPEGRPRPPMPPMDRIDFDDDLS